MLYTLAVALTSGARPSIAAAFGCTLGIVPQMLAAMLGLAAVLHTSALAFAALNTDPRHRLAAVISDGSLDHHAKLGPYPSPRPRQEDTVELEAEIVVQARGIVALDDEAQLLGGRDSRFARWLVGLAEVALGAIGDEAVFAQRMQPMALGNWTGNLTGNDPCGETFRPRRQS